jgi:hypothetical protein
VALVGRVPVNVTTKNGVIKTGDRITTSDISGYGMRATKAGKVLGTAISDLDLADVRFCPDDEKGEKNYRCGQVMVFVNLVDYSGMSITNLLSEAKAGLSFGGTFNDSMYENYCVDAEGTATSTSADGLCEDGLTLSKKTVSNSTTTNSVGEEFASKAKDREGEIIDYLKSIRPNVDGNIGLDSEIFTDRLSAAFEIFAPRFITEGLRVDHISALSQSIIFNSDVDFFGTPYFTTDTAGFAVVKAGSIQVDVVFDREYIERPIVNASMASSDGIISSPDTLLAVQEFFGNDVRFLISNASTTGFTIFINKPTDKDIHFNWIALAVKNAKLFTSQEGDVNIQQPVQITEPVNDPTFNSQNTVPVIENPQPLLEVSTTTFPGTNIEEQSAATTTNNLIENSTTTPNIENIQESTDFENGTSTPAVVEVIPEPVSETETTSDVSAPNSTTEISENVLSETNI